jgi:hypothetical protein
MTMIGVDPHKATHAAVAVDDDEYVIDEFTLEASRSQTERLTGWVDQFAKREWVGCRVWEWARVSDCPPACRSR